MHPTPILLALTTLFLGLRHGIDWDHIAAITDVTTSTKDRNKAFLLGTMYALGHGMVIVILGICAVAIGVRLPNSVDVIMEPLVGLTLIVLGLYLGFSIIREGRNVKLQSRWMALYEVSKKLYDKIHTLFGHSHKHEHVLPKRDVGVKTATIIGIIHGIGAETPTQLLLFTTAGGIGGQPLGILVVITFVIGLLLSNTLITIFSIFGIARVKENSTLYLFLAGVAAVFSLALGTLFILGKGGILPSILGV